MNSLYKPLAVLSLVVVVLAVDVSSSQPQQQPQPPQPQQPEHTDSWWDRAGDSFIHRALTNRQRSVDALLGAHSTEKKEHAQGFFKRSFEEDVVAALSGARVLDDHTLSDDDVALLTSRKCPLYFAVQYRNKMMVQLLVSVAPEESMLECFQLRDAAGDTLWHVVARSKTSGLARLLLSACRVPERVFLLADMQRPEALNCDGIEEDVRRPGVTYEELDAAVGHHDLALLAGHPALRGCMLNARNNTALSIAVAGGLVQGEVLARLVEASKECLDARNMYGHTVLHAAALSTRPAHMISALEAVLPGVEELRLVRDDYGRTAGDIYDAISAPTVLQGPCPHEPISRFPVWFETRAFDKVEPPAEKTIDRLCVDNEVEIGVDGSVPDTFDFPRDVALRGRPVLLAHAANNWLSNDVDAAWFDPRGLAASSFSRAKVRVQMIPHVGGGDVMPLRDFVTERMLDESPPVGAQPYIFETNTPSTRTFAQKLAVDKLPFASELGTPRLTQVAIGRRGSGASPHFHGRTINALVFGLKLFYFFPPTQRQSVAFSSETALDWRARATGKPDCGKISDSPEQELHTCAVPGALVTLQRPGDIVFIPDNWSHAVINLEDSGAVALEFAELF